MNKSDHKRQIEKAHPFRSRNTEDAILSSLKETDNFKSLNFISTLGYALKSRTGFEDILKTIMTKLDTQLKAESQTIHLVDRANDIFESYFFADKDIFKIEKIPLTDKSMIAGIALEKRKTIIIPSENRKYTTKGDLLSAQSEKPKSALCVPMISRGESLGVIELINKTDGTIFNETDLTFLVSISILGVCADFPLEGVPKTPLLRPLHQCSYASSCFSRRRRRSTSRATPAACTS